MTRVSKNSSSATEYRKHCSANEEKELWIEGRKIKLIPGNGNYEPIEMQKSLDFRTQGVVTWVVKKTG